MSICRRLQFFKAAELAACLRPLKVKKMPYGRSAFDDHYIFRSGTKQHKRRLSGAKRKPRTRARTSAWRQ